jgi:hypothetical protein
MVSTTTAVIPIFNDTFVRHLLALFDPLSRHSRAFAAPENISLNHNVPNVALHHNIIPYDVNPTINVDLSATRYRPAVAAVSVRGVRAVSGFGHSTDLTSFPSIPHAVDS